MTIDTWPNEEEMAERCGCGHLLGQHSYGTDLAPCEVCGCRSLHPLCATTEAGTGLRKLEAGERCPNGHLVPEEAP